MEIHQASTFLVTSPVLGLRYEELVTTSAAYHLDFSRPILGVQVSRDCQSLLPERHSSKSVGWG
jgi:hypothetical protein